MSNCIKYSSLYYTPIACMARLFKLRIFEPCNPIIFTEPKTLTSYIKASPTHLSVLMHVEDQEDSFEAYKNSLLQSLTGKYETDLKPPKAPMNPFMRYHLQRSTQERSKNPDVKMNELTTRIADEWKRLDPENRSYYEQLYQARSRQRNDLLKEWKRLTRKNKVFSPFYKFYAKMYPLYQAQFTEKSTKEIVHMVSEEWKNLEQSKKQQYIEEHEQDKIIYSRKSVDPEDIENYKIEKERYEAILEEDKEKINRMYPVVKKDKKEMRRQAEEKRKADLRAQKEREKQERINQKLKQKEEERQRLIKQKEEEAAKRQQLKEEEAKQKELEKAKLKQEKDEAKRVKQEEAQKQKEQAAKTRAEKQETQKKARATSREKSKPKEKAVTKKAAPRASVAAEPARTSRSKSRSGHGKIEEPKELPKQLRSKPRKADKKPKKAPEISKKAAAAPAKRAKKTKKIQKKKIPGKVPRKNPIVQKKGGKKKAAAKKVEPVMATRTLRKRVH